MDESYRSEPTLQVPLQAVGQEYRLCSSYPSGETVLQLQATQTQHKANKDTYYDNRILSLYRLGIEPRRTSIMVSIIVFGSPGALIDHHTS